jgi:hypothetical protein
VPAKAGSGNPEASGQSQIHFVTAFSFRRDSPRLLGRLFLIFHFESSVFYNTIHPKGLKAFCSKDFWVCFWSNRWQNRGAGARWAARSGVPAGKSVTK